MGNITKDGSFEGIEYKFLRKEIKKKQIHRGVEMLLGKKKLIEKEKEEAKNQVKNRPLPE